MTDRRDQHNVGTPPARYWIAINGSSCAMSIMPWRNPTTIPIAQQMFGFPTLKEAEEAQRICLYATIPEVKASFDSLAPNVASGRIIHKRPAHADPHQPGGHMTWMEAPATPDEKEMAKAERNAWANVQDGAILPGLPGGRPLH